MSTVAVRALKPVTYDTREYVAGEEFYAKPLDALLMSRRQTVTVLPRGRRIIPRDVVAESTTEETPEPKRRYRRRDLTAEP